MQRLRIDIQACPSHLRNGLDQIVRRRPASFSSAASALAIRFAPLRPDGSPPRLDVHFDGAAAATVSYSRPIDAFRGLGRLLGVVQSGGRAGHSRGFAETCAFDLLGVLVDCSRNGVLRPEVAEDLLCSLALMGFNAFIPYMEDTFEVPGEPFFGYLRGRYTHAELRRIDRFAGALGIEVFPAIQTLGHLEQLLQWPVYADLRDVPGVLLADHPPTYALLEKMIRAATSPLRSRRIYATMDEAHGLGTGRYRARFGPADPFDILNRHMRQVVEICNKLGLRPMTSGDMYFRVGSKKNEYYDTDSVIPSAVAQAIPPEMQLVYWDYYHTDPAFYKDWIDRHRAMGKEPAISGGVWVWSHLWAALPFSMATTDALMAASKARGVRENIATLWGDDGMECDLFSALPGLQYYADHAYGERPDRKSTAANLRGTCGIDLGAWSAACEIDQLPTLTDPQRMPGNCSKWLLWEDPLLGLLQPQLGTPAVATRAARHYANLATKLFAAARREGIDRHLRFPAQIARVLSLKVGMHPRLSIALRSGDRRRLSAIQRDELPALRREVDLLWKLHRRLWLDLYKPFGLEVLEGRYGGLRTRLATLSDRLADYLAGRIDTIPELDTRLRRIFPAEDVYTLLDHGRAATASMIK